ncbi:TIR domain-containing protein [Empedobacter tilapiae]|uniref:TIR domain-containing protein n=1 Tax=Empedobacter tilapiae TaxID=2491114 RepID=UPI0028D17C24|nr:TIR domain-containing protein [Empedobacter tilapiae]
MKWADYCVSKLSLNENGFIDSIKYYNDLGETLSNNSYEQNRSWMVREVLKGKTFCSIKRNKGGRWNEIGDFSYDGRIFSWKIVPKNIVKRKTFISYYHHDDQDYKERFKNLFGDLITHKSVEDGDIDSDNSDGYIKQLIQKGYLADTTVLVVLIGPNTKHRKHIDWEISGALNPKVGDKCAGILGLKLPNHPDYGTGSHHYNLLPDRLSDNLRSDYAVIRDWTDDRIKMQEYIELAFEKRNTNYDDRDNSRLQMTENTNE